MASTPVQSGTGIGTKPTLPSAPKASMSDVLQRSIEHTSQTFKAPQAINHDVYTPIQSQQPQAIAQNPKVMERVTAAAVFGRSGPTATASDNTHFFVAVPTKTPGHATHYAIEGFTDSKGGQSGKHRR
jgi:hypothetical protein